MTAPAGPPRRKAPRNVLVFTRQAIRRLDALAVDRYHIPSIVLMENAAVHLATVARRMLGRSRASVAIFCGPGNNGGDGLALARHLHNSGHQVRIVLAADPARTGGDAGVNLAIARAMGIETVVRPRRCPAAALVVDALLGTGLDRPVAEPMAGLIRMINRSRPRVLSVDLPSGMNAETGEPMGLAVRADVTVTMAGWKQGFLSRGARAYLGRVIVADIGVPRALAEGLATGR
jgi:NAD(P)H-hydrate epimerase